MFWNDISYVLGSKLSRKILESLKEERAPNQIAKETGIARSNVSTKLVELRKRELVICLNPDARKWRFYIISEKGKEVLDKVKEIKQ